MKLRNKKTGEIVEFDYVGGINSGWCPELIEFQQYHSIKEFNEEWEDYKE